MAYRVMSNGANIQSNVVEIVVDTRTDLEDVPTTFGIGSDVICLEDSSVFMLGNDKTWHEI